MECSAWCSGSRRPLIAGRLSLQRLGVDLPVTRPVRDSNPIPHASESRSLANCAIGATIGTCLLYFVYNPGLAETLDMRHEGETFGILTQTTRVSPRLQMSGKKRSTHISQSAEQSRSPHISSNNIIQYSVTSCNVI